MIAIATLDGADLPVNFSYRPYIQRKRTTVTATANAVVTQAARPSQIVDGDGIIPWEVNPAKPDEFQFFHDKYSTAGLVLYTFTGYWNEVAEVLFNVFDEPRVRGRLFELSGSFQVICVTTPFTGVDCRTGL